MLTCQSLSAIALLARVDAALASRAGLSRAELARELEVSPRTVARYTEFLADRLGRQPEYDPVTRRWRYAPGSPPAFTEDVHARAL